MKSIALVFYLFLIAPVPVTADVLVLNSGEVVTGTILQEQDRGVFMRLRYGTLT